MSAPESSYAPQVFAEALGRIGRRELGAIEREQASAILRFIARYVPLDERVVTDVMNVLSGQLSDDRVVCNLVYAVRRSSCAMKLASGLHRLASRAHRERHWASFVTIVSAMQETRAWRDHVTEGFFVDAVEHAVGQDRWWLAANLIHHRLHEVEDVPVGVGDVLEAHPRLLQERPVTASQAWRLHRARPTPRGWQVLATTPTTSDCVVSPSAFRSELDVAIDTLEAALGSEPEGARRVTLARWLAELRGTP